jgi:Alphavirus glycoprotein J
MLRPHLGRLITLISLFGLCGLIAVLGGCVSVDRSLVLYENGSGTYTLTIGFPEPQKGNPSSISPQIVTPMDAFGAHIQQEGGTYQQYAQQNTVYWTYTSAFTSATGGNQLLQEDPRQYDPNHTPVLFHDALSISKHMTAHTTSYQVTGVISLADPQGLATGWKGATERLAITMATGVETHQGGTLTGDTVAYTIRYNQSTSINVAGNVTTTPGPQVSTELSFLVIGVMLALAVMLAGLGGWLLRSARRAPK